jgi:CheY-like chemotaxis protein
MLEMSSPRHRSSVEVRHLPEANTPLHVFHVDDNPDDHLLLKSAAEIAGLPFTWDVAESADTAIFYLCALVAVEGKGSLVRPDLVLLDVALPQGGGLKVLKFIRSNPRLNSLRVIVFSGSNAPETLEQAYVHGADSVLLKPAAFADLVKLAASLHNGRKTARKVAPGVSRVDQNPLLVGPAR